MQFKYLSLTSNVLSILKDRATEQPFSGEYISPNNIRGSFLCCGCGAVLFRETQQFLSHCGWPSFDHEIKDAIKTVPDADGRRTEIVCANCQGHLGHVFFGEQLTEKNKRHCVNSLAIEFVPSDTVTNTDEVIIAGGCFWGLQHYLNKLQGVLFTEVGYTGGVSADPTYEQVCAHKTGHVEAMRVVFDANVIDCESVLKYFFEIHDPTQVDGQGPDIGSQYLSRIFYFNDAQKKIAEKLIQVLTEKGLTIATALQPVKPFWKAEAYHQHYYDQHQGAPYCHQYMKRF